MILAWACPVNLNPTIDTSGLIHNTGVRPVTLCHHQDQQSINPLQVQYTQAGLFNEYNPEIFFKFNSKQNQN